MIIASIFMILNFFLGTYNYYKGNKKLALFNCISGILLSIAIFYKLNN